MKYSSSEYNREMWVIDGQRSLDTDAKYSIVSTLIVILETWFKFKGQEFYISKLNF